MPRGDSVEGLVAGGTTPRLAAVLNVTDPWRTRYLTYFASVAAWAREMDRVVVIDGHSSEDLLNRSSGLFGSFENVEILRTEQTHWGRGERWHLLQSVTNLNVGLDAVNDCDLVFVGMGDYVPYPGLRQRVLNGPRVWHQKGRWFRYYRTRGARHSLVHRHDARGVVLVRRGAEASPVRLGLDLSTGKASDFPLHVRRWGVFEDPVTSALKPIFAGVPLEPAGTLDVDCGAFGHFWFTREECLSKVRRWDRASARFYGIAPRRDAELSLVNGLNRLMSFRSKADLLGWDWPPEMKRLIDEYYMEGMLGGAVVSPRRGGELGKRIVRKALGGERRVRSTRLRRCGLRGLLEEQEWADRPEDVDHVSPLDVGRIYREQDRCLGGSQGEDMDRPPDGG